MQLKKHTRPVPNDDDDGNEQSVRGRNIMPENIRFGRSQRVKFQYECVCLGIWSS